MARSADAAARVLHQLLLDTGYSRSAADTARLLRISPKNVSAYLAVPGARGRRVRPRIDTLAQWCWAISQTTGLDVSVIADGSGEVYYEISGYDAAGCPTQSERRLTNYRETDARPLPSWAFQWALFTARYGQFYVEAVYPGLTPGKTRGNPGVGGEHDRHAPEDDREPPQGDG